MCATPNTVDFAKFQRANKNKKWVTAWKVLDNNGYPSCGRLPDDAHYKPVIVYRCNVDVYDATCPTGFHVYLSKIPPSQRGLFDILVKVQCLVSSVKVIESKYYYSNSGVRKLRYNRQAVFNVIRFLEKDWIAAGLPVKKK